MPLAYCAYASASPPAPLLHTSPRMPDASITLPIAGRLPIDRVRLLRGVGVLFPDLDRLVGLAGDQTTARVVKRRGEDATLALERAVVGGRAAWEGGCEGARAGRGRRGEEM